MARPSILNDALIETFCSCVRISGSIESAIMATGIGRETYFGWVHQGGGTGMTRKLIAGVEQAEGEAKLVRESMNIKHFDKDWRSTAQWLARKYPNEYGRRRPHP
jgi:hypothetical protein